MRVPTHSNGKKTQNTFCRATCRIMAPSAVGMDQHRRRAVVRVMEKMLDDESLDQRTFSGMHDAFSVKLWKATRCMSGQEFLLAVEERTLGYGGGIQSGSACAYPGCSVVWGGAEVEAAGARKASGSCCSSICEDHVSAHVARLGSAKDAMARFTGLYELAKREREEKMRLARGCCAADGATGAQMEGEPGSSSKPCEKTKGSAASKNTDSITSGTPKFAAGTTKTPIMHAVVKERSPTASPASLQTKRDQVFDAGAVDGYRLKRQDDVNGHSESRRVRFAPKELLEQKREFQSHEPPGDVKKALTTSTATPEADMNTKTTHQDTAEPSASDSPAQFVFSIEDPRGPVDDDMKSIGDMFGTLNVLVSEEGTSEEAQTPSSGTDVGLPDGDTESVDTILAKTLRDGAKHFPHLTIPEDVAQQINALETELADEGPVSDPPGGDADSELDGFENIDSDFFSTDEDEDVPIRCQKTLFTQIYTFFDYWITDASIDMVAGDEASPKAATPTTPAGIPQVPEVVTAIQRFISIGCTALAAKLCDGIDANANVDKQMIVDRISRLVGTFRLDAALPAFDSKQWLVVCLAMLKALGARSHPHLQKLTETPAGAARVGDILGDACFTGEELLAVVSLLLGEQV